MKLNELKNNELVKHLIEDLDENAGWLCFFLMFSRFEYALKRSGYLKGSKEYVEADWEKFGNDIEPRIDIDINEILKAKKYLLNNPPKKQVIENSNLSWKTMNNLNDDIRSLIHVVKVVRNNLFHGGKDPCGTIDEVSRDNELIENSIIVLKYLLNSSDKIKEKYYIPLKESSS